MEQELLEDDDYTLSEEDAKQYWEEKDVGVLR
jgi:hypothetical protein